MRTSAQYDERLDAWVETILELHDEVARTTPGFRHSGSLMSTDLGQQWVDHLWEQSVARGSTGPTFERMYDWLVVRGKTPRFTLEAMFADILFQDEVMKQFRAMVIADALARLRALPRFRMAVALGEF